MAKDDFRPRGTPIHRCSFCGKTQEQVSRLIAYSSTLVGIIFSVILRLTMQYPLRQKFIALLPPSSLVPGDKK